MYTDPTTYRIIRERDERLFNAAYNDSKFYEAGSKEFKFLHHIMWLADSKDPRGKALTSEHISNFYSDLGVVDKNCYTKIMFQEMTIKNSRFVGIDFRTVPSLRGATFINCKFDKCIFTCTRISSLNLCSCEFTNCEFISSNICCVSMSGDMIFNHCDFDGARMVGVYCQKCNTSSFRLIDCNCRIAQFSGNVPPTFHGRSVYPKKWYKEHLSFSYPENKEEKNMEKEKTVTAGIPVELAGSGVIMKIMKIMKEPEENKIINKVVSNPEKKFVLVWFGNDKKPVKVQCDSEDTFDTYVGVAIALSKQFFKSTTQFRKAVDDVLIEQKPKVDYASLKKATDVEETKAEQQETKEGK